MQPFTNQEERSIQKLTLLIHWTQTFQHPRLWGNTCLLLKSPKCIILCYCNLVGLKYQWMGDEATWTMRLPGEEGSGKNCEKYHKGKTEDEMVGWHHQLYGYEFEQAPGVGDWQGSLKCCCLWGGKESDMIERQLNWKMLEWVAAIFFSSVLLLWKILKLKNN